MAVRPTLSLPIATAASRQAAKRRWISIRWTLPLCVVAPLVAGIALTSWLAFRSGQASVEALVDDISKQAAANIEKQVTSYLTKPFTVSAAVLAGVASGSINLQDTTELGQDLWHLTQSERLSQTLYYGSSSGEFVYSSHKAGQGRLDFRDESTDFVRSPYYTDDRGNLTRPLPESEYNKTEYNKYDPRQRDWYKKAAASNQITWSEVYAAKSNGQLTLTLSTPVLSETSEVEGVFGIDVFLFELSNFLRGLTLSPNAQAFIIEISGNLIAISGEYESQVVAAADVSDPLVRATANSLIEEFEDFSQIDTQHSFEFELAGKKQLAHVYRVQQLGIDWLIGVTIPQADYMQDIRANTRRTLAIGLLITGLASLIALAAALSIIRPIDKLTQTAQDIKQNQFNPDNLADTIARPDEFSELAALFNDMATVVMSREQSLADQVEQLKAEVEQNGSTRGDRDRLESLLKQAKALRQAADRT